MTDPRFPAATFAASIKDEALWRAWRAGEAVEGLPAEPHGVGGTLAVAIAGLGWRSASELWQERRGLKRPQGYDDNLEVGHLMEPILRRRLARAVRGVSEGPVCVVGPEPWMRGSLDDVVRLQRGKRRAWVEIKAVLAGQREEWSETEASLRAVVQGLWYGACTGLTEGFVGGGFLDGFTLDPATARQAAERCELRVYHVVAAEEPWAGLQQRLVARCRAWKDLHLVQGVPPDQEAEVAVSLRAASGARVESRDATDAETALLRQIILRSQARDQIADELVDLRQRLVLLMGATRKITSPLGTALITNPSSEEGQPFLIVRSS